MSEVKLLFPATNQSRTQWMALRNWTWILSRVCLCKTKLTATLNKLYSTVFTEAWESKGCKTPVSNGNSSPFPHPKLCYWFPSWGIVSDGYIHDGWLSEVLYSLLNKSCICNLKYFRWHTSPLLSPNLQSVHVHVKISVFVMFPDSWTHIYWSYTAHNKEPDYSGAPIKSIHCYSTQNVYLLWLLKSSYITSERLCEIK